MNEAPPPAALLSELRDLRALMEDRLAEIERRIAVLQKGCDEMLELAAKVKGLL